MNPALITSIISGLVAIGALYAAVLARGRADRQAESQVIQVTVEAAENVVQLVTAQLNRSLDDYNKLSQRLDQVEKSLAEERGQNLTLRMQLGKVRRRVTDLEAFIKERGWEPPPATRDEDE